MMNLCRSVGKKSSHFCVWHQSHPLLGHFLCILRLDRMLSAPKLCMICSLRYLLEFYNLSTYFPVYRQIDNKTKCINPRIRDTNSFYSPPQCLSMLCMHLYTSVSVRLRVSADMPAYRVILHFGFFSCVFPIYLPQTCQTQGDQEKVKLRTNMAFRK